MTQDSSRYILRMQKSLELMNIKLHTVISDIVGKTGTAIVEAIIAGERKAENFLPYVDSRIKADEQTIVKSLEGNWRSEHITTLKLSYEMYKVLQQKIIECEKTIEEVLQEYIAVNNGGVIEPIKNDEKKSSTKRSKKKTKNQPIFNTQAYLQKIHGVDVTEIFGVSETSALEILAETGTDMTKWANEDKFVKWLNLCPNNKITGGKLISSMCMKKKPNLAAQAFRNAANSLQRSDNWLGDYFRRMKAKGGNKYAIVATARKIAIIYYKMVHDKQPFTPVNLIEFQEKYRNTKIAYLKRKLEQLERKAA
jgi:transposase